MQCNLFDLFPFTLILFVHLRIGIGNIIGKQEDKLLPTLFVYKAVFIFFLSSE